MLVLMAFAFVAGAGTAVSPCVLPVLPAVLSASAVGGRRRPLGIVLGLAATYTIAVVALAKLIDGVGLADGLVRTLAIVVLIGFGLSLLVPALGERVERPLARLARFGPRSAGRGFWSGLAVGGALGFVYAPCAGPVLAAVVSVSATTGTTGELVGIALAYALGSAAVLLVLALAGRRLTDRIRAAGRGPGLQRALGAVLLLTGALMLAQVDVRFQTALANHFPSAIVNPTRALERSDAVERRLAALRGAPRFAETRAAPAPRRANAPAARLPVLGRAPEFTGTQRWFNTAGDRPLTLAGLRGRVVLVDFWTYTCINCLRTLPALRSWDARYRDRGLTIVGVHTPEFPFERDAGNVARAIRQNRLRYAVAQDNRYATWNAYGNQYWPAEYLIDARGNVRSAHFGEGDYDRTEASIRALLAEAGAHGLGARAQARPPRASPDVRTPETYLGTARAERFLPRAPRAGIAAYPGHPGPLPPDHLALRGVWRVGQEAAGAVRGARLDLQFGARRVYLVLGSPGRARKVRVLLDGRPIARSLAGRDVRSGVVAVRAERLYELVSLPGVERRRLSLALDPGIRAYAFTFG